MRMDFRGLFWLGVGAGLVIAIVLVALGYGFRWLAAHLGWVP